MDFRLTCTMQRETNVETENFGLFSTRYMERICNATTLRSSKFATLMLQLEIEEAKKLGLQVTREKIRRYWISI